MQALEPFAFEGTAVRVVLRDGEPWFVAADILSILGLDRTALRRLDDDERGVDSVHTPGGDQQVNVVNEPGLYGLILGSRKPEAKAFKRWVTHEVLPQIRRTGQFGSQVPTSLAEALELAAIEARKIEALEAKAAEDAPKVEAYDALMDADGYYTMDATAKILGMGRVTLYRKLRELGIIQRGSTTPYQRHMHHFILTAGSWTDSKGNIHPSQTTRVRPSGLDYLRKRLSAGQQVTS